MAPTKEGLVVDPSFKLGGEPASAAQIVAILKADKFDKPDKSGKAENPIPPWLRRQISAHENRIIVSHDGPTQKDKKDPAFLKWQRVYESLLQASSSGEWRLASATTFNKIADKRIVESSLVLDVKPEQRPVRPNGEPTIVALTDESQILGWTGPSEARLSMLARMSEGAAIENENSSRMKGPQGLLAIATAIRENEGNSKSRALNEIVETILHEAAAHAGLASANNVWWEHRKVKLAGNPSDDIEKFLDNRFFGSPDDSPDPVGHLEVQTPKKPAGPPKLEYTPSVPPDDFGGPPRPPDLGVPARPRDLGTPPHQVPDLSPPPKQDMRAPERPIKGTFFDRSRPSQFWNAGPNTVSAGILAAQQSARQRDLERQQHDMLARQLWNDQQRMQHDQFERERQASAEINRQRQQANLMQIQRTQRENAERAARDAAERAQRDARQFAMRDRARPTAPPLPDYSHQFQWRGGYQGGMFSGMFQPAPIGYDRMTWDKPQGYHPIVRTEFYHE